MLSCQPQASSTPATALSEARTGGATVVSCGQSGPQQAQDEDLQSYGANSPVSPRMWPALSNLPMPSWGSGPLLLPSLPQSTQK